MIDKFNFAVMPQIYFGAGRIAELGPLIKGYGRSVLFVIGSGSIKRTSGWSALQDALSPLALTLFEESVVTEPSPQLIDEIVARYAAKEIDVVVAIGGGSVVDAGKAISAMYGQGEQTVRFLEAVGDLQHDGSKLPFIAVPTTAGTGSEATKNAVLSNVGANGFKRSLRHNKFVPDAVILDPELHLSCSQSLTAACGMDAFTQLLESYVSTNASPLTDALAMDGLRHVRDGLLPAYRSGDDLDARAAMLWAAFLSGATLANAGLGTVHGFASVIGGYYEIPHGVVCGLLMGEVVRKNISALVQQGEAGQVGLRRYAEVGRLFAADATLPDLDACCALQKVLDDMSAEMELPGLSAFAVKRSDFVRIAAESGNKNNPVELTDEQLVEILEAVY